MIQAAFVDMENMIDLMEQKQDVSWQNITQYHQAKTIWSECTDLKWILLLSETTLIYISISVPLKDSNAKLFKTKAKYILNGKEDTLFSWCSKLHLDQV